MMVEMSGGSVQGEPEARRECTLSTKSSPGGQRDRAGRANSARRGGRRHPRHTLACSGRENGMWPEHRVIRDRDGKERNHRAGLAPRPQVQGTILEPGVAAT